MRRSQLRGLLELAWKLRAGTLGLVIMLGVLAVAVLGPLVAPHDPFAQDLGRRLAPPFWMDGGSVEYALGTDQLGRDVVSRLIYGSRWSLLAGVFAVVVALGIGVPLGLFAGFYGRYADAAVTFLVNVVVAFPFLVLAVAIIAFLGPNFLNLILVLGIAGWTAYARVVRTEVLSLRERDFLMASRAVGASDLRLLRVHLMPNVTDSVLVLASLQVAAMILAEAFLSFIGFGIQPPTPSWGTMLADARVHMLSRWWLATFPGLAIFVAALGVNLLGDGIRDLLDPRTRA